MCRILGNGKDIFLFYYKLINGHSSLISQFGSMPLPVNIQHWRVSDIMENGKWVLKDYSLPPYWNIIQGQVIKNVDIADRWT